jgi:choloylglycine hydrolase
MNKLIFIIVSAIVSVIFTCFDSDACTYFFLKAKDGSIISGRTDEFYSETGSKIDLVPQGISFKTTAPRNAKPLSWVTRYGFVAISMFDKDIFGDGMNEKGLAAGGLWFGDSEYPKIKPGDEVINMSDIIGWILGNYQTVAEVKSALQKVKIWADADNPLKMTLPMHFYVTDSAGDSIVVECIRGKAKIWDNRANGVMTNEPDLGWHLKNLRFYSHMNPNGVPVPELNDEQWSLGTGLMGLPGDYTDAGRFVRISVLKYFSEKPKDAPAGVILAMHLINTIDIPYGPQVWIQGQQGSVQWTIWSVIYDQTNHFFYYRTYDNPNLRRFDFAKLPLGKGSARKRIEIFGGNGYIEDTSRLRAP